jgi:hypothetical protein
MQQGNAPLVIHLQVAEDLLTGLPVQLQLQPLLAGFPDEAQTV